MILIFFVFFFQEVKEKDYGAHSADPELTDPSVQQYIHTFEEEEIPTEKKNKQN